VTPATFVTFFNSSFAIAQMYFENLFKRNLAVHSLKTNFVSAIDMIKWSLPTGFDTHLYVFTECSKKTDMYQVLLR